MRAITAQGNQFLLTHWNADSSWYSPRLHKATFIILPANALASLRSVYGAVGRPVRTYHLGLYVVMVWRKNLLNGPFVSGRFVGWDILAARRDWRNSGFGGGRWPRWRRGAGCEGCGSFR